MDSFANFHVFILNNLYSGLGGIAQVVECLSSKLSALHSILSTAKENKTKKKQFILRAGPCRNGSWDGYILTGKLEQKKKEKSDRSPR
jgi:hypothetical protein